MCLKQKMALACSALCSILAEASVNNSLQEESVDVFVDLLLLAGRALGPIIRRFISLGLNRVWTKAGDTVYRQGEPAESLYILISGRLRLLRADPGGEGPMVVEEEVRPFMLSLERMSLRVHCLPRGRHCSTPD